MMLFPHAKINLGLRITSRREDGYHSIETIFLPIGWCDILEWLPSGKAGTIHLSLSGHDTAVPPEKNLVYKTLQILSSHTRLPGIRMHLHKNLPPGSGLGGGSSDAAFLLKEVAKYHAPELSSPGLQHLALSLGSDCPFFLQDQACLATGRGEILDSLKLETEPYEWIVLVPPVQVSTAWAYSRVIPRIPESPPLSELVNEPVSDWKGIITNDFEPVVFDAFPEIRELRDRLYEAGALYASLSGSGSAVYGIFHEGKAPGKETFRELIYWKGKIKKPGQGPVQYD